jgi:chaperonin GroES
MSESTPVPPLGTGVSLFIVFLTSPIFLIKQTLLNTISMNLRPLADRLIIAAGKKEEVTASGLVLPDTASKERPEQGEVIAVGPGRLDEDGERMPMSVKVGDTVVFKKYAPDEVEVDGKEYLVISESDVLAVIVK